MKIAFIIQGEGRGHLSQAICLKQMLGDSDLEIDHVFYGLSKNREIPEYFKDAFKETDITYFQSPSFNYDKRNRKLRILKSFLINILKAPVYFKSIRKVYRVVKETKPDIIINFYDLIGGLMNYVYHPDAKYIAVSHHYFFSHSEFVFPKNRKVEKRLLLLHNKIVSLKADKKLALSFRKEKDMPKKRLFIVPPLIREEIIKAKPKQEGFILCYLLKEGYIDEVIKSGKATNTEIIVFSEKLSKPKRFPDNIHHHKIDNNDFVDHLINCRGYITSSGFDSVCEAMYLKKPVMMIPTQNHFEQYCNSLDAVNEGAGIVNSKFDIKRMIAYIPKHKKDCEEYINWVDLAKDVFISHLKD